MDTNQCNLGCLVEENDNLPDASENFKISIDLCLFFFLSRCFPSFLINNRLPVFLPIIIVRRRIRKTGTTASIFLRLLFFSFQQIRLERRINLFELSGTPLFRCLLSSRRLN